NLVDTGVHVVFAVLEDTDGRLGRVTVLVERDRTGVAVVVGNVTVEDDLGGRREVGCLLTVAGAAGDFLQLAGDVGTRGRVGSHGSQRDQDDGVVRLSRVAEVGQGFGSTELFHPGCAEALLEVVFQNRARRGALG